jgi:hypothetical protein
MSEYLVPTAIGLLGGFFIAVRVVKLMPGERAPRFKDEPASVRYVMYVVPTAFALIAAFLVFLES